MFRHGHEIAAALLTICAALVWTPARAADVDHPARIAAEWAIGTERADTLADSIRLLLDYGHRIDPGDPFTVSDLMTALETLPGGEALAADIRATAARGQIGGASRVDMQIAPGETLRTEVKMAPDEAAIVEARLFRGTPAADIDLRILDADGQLLGQDTGPETGIEGVGAYVEIWPDACTTLTVETINTGTEPARIAILAPLSLNTSC